MLQRTSFGKNLSFAIHFGWTSTQPPKNSGYVEINAGDVLQTAKGPVPTDQFVREIATQLIRTGQTVDNGVLDIDTPGIAAISGQSLMKILGNLNNVNIFYSCLAKKVLITLKSYAATSLRLPRIRSTIAQVDIQDAIKANVKGRTTKKPHFDPNGLFVSHLYLPTENVSGGNFQVFDIKQYLVDHPGQRLKDITQKSPTSSNILVNLSNEDIAPYKIEFDNASNAPMIVFLNNTPQAAIAHGVSETSIINESQPHNRSYRRISLTKLTPKRILDKSSWNNALKRLRQLRGPADSKPLQTIQ